MQISVFTVLAAAASFAAALPTNTSCATPPTPTCGKLGNFHKTTVKKGQTLKIIADRFHSGICDIAWQNKLANPNVIYAGQELLVPVDVCNPDNTSCLTPEGQATCVKGGPATYKVGSGDTFFVIAQELGLTTDSLTGANPTTPPESLQVNQTIVVPVCK